MKRLAYLGAVSLAVLAFAGTTTAAPASHWTDLNKALAPVNVALATDVQLLNKALADAGNAQQNVAFGSAFRPAELQGYIADLQKAVKLVVTSMAGVRKDAQQGIKVLDSFAPEQCSVHFTGTEYTMFAMWDDTIASLQAQQSPAAAGAAFYLGGFSGVDGTRLPAGGPVDLEWDHVTCAGHVARPTTAPSAAPSA